MAAPREPVFLARDTYRRRRLIDAMRLVPVAGALFFLVPMLGSGSAARLTSLSGLYIFAVWFLLIVAAGVLTRLLSRGAEGSGADPLEASARGGGGGDQP